MIAPMGRFAKIWALGLVAFMAAAACLAPSGQAEQPEQVGPTYSLRDLRRLEFEGVRLGMTEGETSDALIARGFTVVANGPPGRVHFFSPDGKTRIGLGYANERGPRIVNTIGLQRSDIREEMLDIEARRAEFVAKFGIPTRWRRAVEWSGFASDGLLYASNQTIADNHLDLWACRFDWRCSNVDCRGYLSSMRRGAMISIDLGTNGYYIEAFDFSSYASELRHDRAFLARDTSGAICFVPYIH